MVNAMEICSCAGGMALGFRRAGIEFGVVVDKDEDACASYTHNMGHAPLRMDLRDLLRLAQCGWRPGKPLDLLVADPPCTPWSSAGKKAGLNDERDCLRPLIELVHLLEPRAFLLGNVPGLDHENAAEALADTVGALSYRGYCIDHVVLDAADYGVPQRRIRPFWYAYKGRASITWPSPTHGPPTRQLAIGGTELLPWVTCRQALCDLPLDELGKVRRLRPPAAKNGGGAHPWSEPDAPAHTICARHDGGSAGGDVLKVMANGFPPSHADEPGRTVTTRASAGGNRMVVEPTVLPWPWDRPATTVCGENWIPQPGHTQTSKDKWKGKPYQGWKAVVLSERARARLQSFPDHVCGCNGGFPLAELEARREAHANGDQRLISITCQDCWLPRRPWTFVGKTKGSRNAQIGMAMSPLLAEAVARSVREWFEREGVTVC